MMRRYWKDLSLMTVLFLMPALYFAETVFANRTFYAWDLANVHYPLRVFAAATLKEGQIPLWDPYVHFGFPLLAEAQVGVLYPLNLFFLLPIPPYRALTGFILIHYSLAGIFTYLLARSLAQSRAASFVCAVAFAYSGYLVAQVQNLDIMTGSVWLPLILFLFLQAVTRKRYQYAALAGVAIALQILTSQPQIFFYTALTLGLYCSIKSVHIARSHTPEHCERLSLLKSALGPWYLLFVTLVIGVGLSAAQLLPTYELKQLSVRAQGLSYDSLVEHSLPWYNLIAFIFPNYLGNPIIGYVGEPYFWEHHSYIGILPLFFVILAWKHREKEEVTLFLIAALASIPLALGKHTPLYRLLQYVPGFNFFQVPARWLFVMTFGLSMLSGYGFDFFIEQIEKEGLKAQLNRMFLASLLTTLVALALFVFRKEAIKAINFLLAEVYSGLPLHVVKGLVKGLTRFPTEAQTSPLVRLFPVLLNPLVLFLLVLNSGLILVHLYCRKKVPRRGFEAAMISLIVLDLLLSGGTTIHPVRASSYWQEQASTTFLKNSIGLARIHPMEQYRDPTQALGQHFPALYDIQSSGGVSPLVLQRVDDFMDVLDKDFRLLNIAGVRYILTIYDDLDELKRNHFARVYYEEKSGFNIYENFDVLPRTFIVHRAESISGETLILDRLASSDLDLSTTIILEREEPVARLANVDSPVTEGTDRSRITTYSPHHVVIETESDRPGFLFLSDSYYPGWKAYLDGQEVEIYRADYVFRAVFLPEGRHVVEFRYAPCSFRGGVVVSLLTAAMALFILTKRRSDYIGAHRPGSRSG